jgi:hypothetical protein
MKTKDTAYWRDVVEKLRMDHADAVAAELAAARDGGAAALPASLGDAKAVARLAEADEREAAAGRRVRQLGVALEDAEGQLRAAQQAEADARTAARRGQLAEVAAQQVAYAAEVDRAAAALARAMAGYDQNIAGMMALGLDVTRQRRLTNRTMIAGALHLSGLSGKVPLAPCSPHHRKRLEDWSRQMLADVMDPPQPAAQPVEAAA